MSAIGSSGQNPYVNQNDSVARTEPVKPQEQPGLVERVAKSPASGVALTTAAGTAAAVLTAGGGALLAATPVGWGLMAGGLVAAAWSIWSSK